MVGTPADSEVVKHLAYQIKTSPQKYLSSFKREINATERDLIVKVSKHTATDYLKMENAENVSVYADRTSMLGGRKAMIRVAKGTKATIEFPVYPKILQWTGRSHRRGGNTWDSDTWAQLEETIQCAAVSIHAMHDAVCLVGGDESIWGFGKRV